ncbi:MAG TPA: FkbM family methyltransferase [Myxococcales bacterium]|jgi:FkbM family methyltransferase
MNRRDFLLGTATGIAGITALGPLLNLALDAKGKGSKSTGGAKPDFQKVSYAQQGEDLIIDNILRDTLGLQKPTYLDIGAYDPVICNNTYLLYLSGGHGVLVEPNPRLVERLRAVRPRDTVLNVGIGVDDAKEADYYEFEVDQMNTFDGDEAQRLQKAGEKLVKTVKMPLLNINRVIAENLGGKAPDLLSIDTEGFDLPILKSLDFEKFRPAAVCAEILKADTFETRPEIQELLAAKRYVIRGMTFVNAVFVDSDRLK